MSRRLLPHAWQLPAIAAGFLACLPLSRRVGAWLRAWADEHDPALIPFTEED